MNDALAGGDDEVNDVTERGVFNGGQLYAVTTTMRDGGQQIARSAMWADDHLLVLIGAVSPDDGALDVNAVELERYERGPSPRDRTARRSGGLKPQSRPTSTLPASDTSCR